MRSIRPFILFSVIICCRVSLFAQTEELKKAQDARKIHMDPATQPTYFSKSLLVNPFIGTGGHGHTYPGAAVPFGMIQLSPDTRHDGWDGCSGYHYSDSIIYGFSHTHLSGTGVPDYCDLLIVPQSGTAKTEPGYLSPDGYGSSFDHASETAVPGNYQVHLKQGNIDVDLAVTERCGIHEYTFGNTDKKRYILIDLDHRDKLLDSEINIIDKKTISGKRISSSWANEQHFYFHLEFDKPFKSARVIDQDGKHKLLLTFPGKVTMIRMKVGISAVDVEGAKKNLEKEIPDWDIMKVKIAATKVWNKELDKISFVADDKDVMVNFYTALYHSFLNPNIFNDVDGRYRGRDNGIHTLDPEEGNNYTVFSLWDTYRATHPLFTLTQVKRTNEFIRTFMRQYEQGGDLPVWELAANETECMIGYHSASVIADAWIKGIRDYDGRKALDAMIATSNFDEFGKRQFHLKGFISSGIEPESVSKTLEYAYDDFCIAHMARFLPHDGMMETYAKYYNSSLNFINMFDPEGQFMRARRDGIWYAPFDPSEVNFNYTEANSWQYSMYAPHAISILSDLMRGNSSMESWLDRLFNENSDLSGRHQVDITGLIGQYAHGNEPSHHMAYLYNYTDASYKTQIYVDSILNTMYRNEPDGLSGNEDCGQMSSWYVLSAMGLYQVTPAHPWYDFGRPIMNEAIIRFENGNQLAIRTENNSPENKFIQKIIWNDQEWTMNQIHHSSIIQGGEILFVMGPEPAIGTFKPNMSALNKDDLRGFVPLPFFTETQRVFDDSLTVVIGHHDAISGQKIEIEYRLLDDTNRIYRYNEPFTIYETTHLQSRQKYIYNAAVGGMPGDIVYYSSWVDAVYSKREKGKELTLYSEYDNQYASAGKNSLIDGVRGNNEYRTGDWQGYWARDVIAVIKFDQPTPIRELGVGCLRDMKSWIFYPSEIIIETSTDGVNYQSVATITIQDLDREEMGSEHKDFTKQVNIENARFIRYTIKNYGKCPAWHLGAGNDTWLFIDELIAR